MDQKNNQSTSQLQTEAAKWAYDELELDPQGSTANDKQARRQVVAAFFDHLKSNGFYVDSEKVEAVELVLGKPAASVSALRKYLCQQGFQRLDDLVEWFASHLGVMPGDDLLASMQQKLSGPDQLLCADDVNQYAQRIWQTCLAVDRKVRHGDPAVTKIFQALFHISTIRHTQRCRVRSQWLGRLRNEFLVAELVVAKKKLRPKSVVPASQFHRPFLFMLTRVGSDLDQVRLPPPVDSRRYATGVQQHSGDSSVTSPVFDRFTRFFFVFMAISLGLGFVSSLSESSSKKPFNVIKAKQEKGDRLLKAIVEEQIRKRNGRSFEETPTDQTPPFQADPNWVPFGNQRKDSLQESISDRFPGHQFDPWNNFNSSPPDVSPGGGR